MECASLAERLLVAADQLEFWSQVAVARWSSGQGAREVLAVAWLRYVEASIEGRGIAPDGHRELLQGLVAHSL